MVNRTLNSHMSEVVRIRLEIKALEELLERHESSIKKELEQRNTDTYSHKNIIVRYQKVESRRFDSKRFKTDYPDLAKKYTKISTTKRFTIQS